LFCGVDRYFVDVRCGEQRAVLSSDCMTSYFDRRQRFVDDDLLMITIISNLSLIMVSMILTSECLVSTVPAKHAERSQCLNVVGC
jgi:hypothetical protein